MTHKVIHLASRTSAAGARVHTSAQHSQPIAPERQAAIENALTMALHFVRRVDATPADLWAATSRASRAAAMLKQACESAAGQQAGGRA